MTAEYDPNGNESCSYLKKNPIKKKPMKLDLGASLKSASVHLSETTRATRRLS